MKKLKTWQIVVIVLVVLGILGSIFGANEENQPSATPEPIETETSSETSRADFAIETVKERYAECFAELDLQGEFVYRETPDEGTAKDLGEVLITIPGGILTFDTGYAEGGAFITIPSDSETTQILEGVGC
jgi:hypothetical protein